MREQVRRLVEQQMAKRGLRGLAQERIAVAIGRAIRMAARGLKGMVDDPQREAEMIVAEILDGAHTEIVRAILVREREAREKLRNR